ncbi:hypothetical protein DFH09DRAFT_1098682 [Mycena vulgaris]|nr:hypothetical protein DFH09DRAFT_1098682 [Mycena vulgaris]
MSRCSDDTSESGGKDLSAFWWVIEWKTTGVESRRGRRQFIMAFSAALRPLSSAKKLLADVGLTTAEPPTNLDDHGFLEVSRVISQALPVASVCSAVRGSLYHPPPARAFSAEEIRRGFDCIIRQTYVNALVDHPLGSVVEYPETGNAKGFAIAHRFSVDPANFSHPRESFQYSLGDSHGGNPDVYCGSLLLGQTGRPAACFHKKSSYSVAEAKKEIFVKTLAFFCTLVEKGCAFDLRKDGEDIDSIGLTDDDPESELESDESGSETSVRIFKDSRRKKSHWPRFAKYVRFLLNFITVLMSSHRCEHRKKTDKAHLILRTLDEFDIPYLRALLANDSQAIDEREELAPQKELCLHWHRDSGKLTRDVLQRFSGNCTAKFDIYTPDDLFDCPQIIVICRNPHSHQPPHPVKTPPPLLEVFRSLLLDLDWKLADVTPRKLMIDFGFIANFRRRFGWNKPFDPPLAALHPSLGSLDHVHNCLQLNTACFPKMNTVIGTRAFTTSQSAKAHSILFTRTFEIAHADTGIPCRFRHIHGEGFELWITDAHKGQALGAGMYYQKLCAELGDVYCPMEPTRLLRTLDPYEQLQRFLRLCTAHYKRHIDEMRPYTTQKVHPDLEGAFQIIENGGRKAKAWLKDKRIGSKFALPALYQPLSLIPLDIWTSAPSTTNGNEQAHRNINRDGVNLTMLGGIMRGMQYDARAMGALELHASQGIYSRDQTSTHFRRLQRSLNGHGIFSFYCNHYLVTEAVSVIVQTRVAARDALEHSQQARQDPDPIPLQVDSLPANQTRSQASPKTSQARKATNYVPISTRIVMASIADFTKGVFSLLTLFDLDTQIKQQPISDRTRTRLAPNTANKVPVPEVSPAVRFNTFQMGAGGACLDRFGVSELIADVPIDYTLRKLPALAESADLGEWLRDLSVPTTSMTPESQCARRCYGRNDIYRDGPIQEVAEIEHCGTERVEVEILRKMQYFFHPKMALPPESAPDNAARTRGSNTRGRCTC